MSTPIPPPASTDPVLAASPQSEQDKIAAYDAMSKEEKAVFDKAQKDKEEQEQAALPYSWTQDLATATLTVPLPDGTRAKSLTVEIKKRRMKVQIKGSPEPIFAGELFADIKEEDSTWTIQDSSLQIELEKVNKQQWWPHVLTHHPKIDTTKIVPENSKLGDLDGETRGMVEKMMFDNAQKQMGKPTSDELKKQEMLEKFKRSHPEMDFSNAKIG